MKNYKIVLFLLLTIPLGTLNAQEINIKKANAKLDAMIQQGMNDWQIPGLAVTVVKGGEVLFKKTYGVKDVETGEKVDNQTLFVMASTTKAVVAMGLAILVDDGKLHWDDRVIDHLPEFQLSDPYITREARIQDLLTHNLGLGNADMLWFGNKLSMDETVAQMKYAPMRYTLRGDFIYQNIMYAAAGLVIERISGENWYNFLKKRLFDPLGMNHTVGFQAQVEASTNKVTAHQLYKEEVIAVPTTYSDGIGPAGMLWSSVDDITRYEQFLTQNGIYNGDTLIQRETFEYLFKPHTLIPQPKFYPTTQLTAPNWTSYGLGWFQHDYKGEKLDFHTGSLPGLIAINGQLRSYDLGVYVFANMDHAELRHAIMYKVMDLYALGGDRDWNKEVFNLYKKFDNAQQRQLADRDSARVTGTQPTHELDTYTGSYTNEMYGTVEITLKDDQLHANLNDFMKVRLDHWHYDTFITEYLEPAMMDGSLVNFTLDSSGKPGVVNFMGMDFTRESE